MAFGSVERWPAKVISTEAGEAFKSNRLITVLLITDYGLLLVPGTPGDFDMKNGKSRRSVKG